MAVASTNEKWIQSTCKNCLAGCGIRVKVKNGVAVKIEGDPSNPDNYSKLCPKGNAGLNRLYDPNRVKTPLRRTNPEKGPGVDPKWEEISWEEAFNIVGSKFKSIRESDPRKLLCAINDFQRIFNWAWPAGFGSPHYFSTVGQYCGAAYHPINGMVDGSFAVVNDYNHCNYWIQIGSGDGFSSHLHLSGSAKRMADARMRGMKVVIVEPRMSVGAAKADEWIPIIPGTDRAFVFGMMHVMVHELNQYDDWFLKKHTNSAYLVDSKGYLVRDEETKKPMIWDPIADKAKVFDDHTIKDFALLNSYVVKGVSCKPGFQVYKELIADYTPEKMSKITSVSAETIRRIAKEFVEAAKIGSTIKLDGKEYPYRPAAINFYRGAIAHKDGALDCMAFKMINMMVGNIDVPGGHIGVPLDHKGLWIAPGPDGMIEPQPHMLHPPMPFKYPPDSGQLMEYFPLGVDPGHLQVETFNNPDWFGHNFKPEAMLIYHSNFLWNMPGTDGIMKILESLDLIVAIDVVLNETTELADIVLPDHHYLESTLMVCLEQPVVLGHSLRQPVVKPLHNSKDASEILIEIAERAGFLNVWNDMLNFLLGLTSKPELMLDPNKKYSIEEIMDRQAKAIYGDDKGLEWFKENGHAVRILKPEEVYMLYGEHRIPFYNEYIKKVGEELKENLAKHNVDWDISNYEPLPYWKSSFLHDEKDYDMYAITFKDHICNFAESTSMAWIQEVAEKMPDHMGVLINPLTAKEKGLKNGDAINIESPFGKIQGNARLTEGVHPQVIAISNVLNRWAQHPIVKKNNTHFNKLLSTKLEHTCNQSGSLESAARVRISKV